MAKHRVSRSPLWRGPSRSANTGGAQQFRNAEDIQAEIANMLDSGKFTWARDTLEGIAETIERTMYVTEGQRRALNNIRERAGWDPLDE